jgi:hypothetical protein
MAKNSVIQTLKKASEGLLFPSETDAPFEPFVWEGEEGKPDKARVLELAGPLLQRGTSLFPPTTTAFAEIVPVSNRTAFRSM